MNKKNKQKIIGEAGKFIRNQWKFFEENNSLYKTENLLKLEENFTSRKLIEKELEKRTHKNLLKNGKLVKIINL